jgi:hypothetical protein
VLVADTDNGALRRIGTDGVVRTVSSGLAKPADVVVLPDGSYAVTEPDRDQVVRVSREDGAVSLLAGSGRLGFAGDGGPAVNARLNGPTALAVSGDALLIADTGNRAVRRVGGDGLIVTIAGVRPDGVVANGAGRLDALYGIAVTASGELLVSQPGRIVAVASDGSARVLAGTGRPGFNGDRHVPLQTQLDHPTQLAVTAAGAVVIADTVNDRLRQVGPLGALGTVAGSDTPGLKLAPVPRAPFVTRQSGGGGGGSGGGGDDGISGGGEDGGGGGSGGGPHRSRRGTTYTRRPARVQVRREPLCAASTTRFNYLKIHPYTATVVQSSRRPAVIEFGVAVDADVTAYAWRNGRHYGEIARFQKAGTRQMSLRGTLSAGSSYYAVVLGKHGKDVACDARRLKVKR